ncbi:MAG: tetratricopeptide repeat protein [Pyrinomonadaceae bacterium]
MYVSREEYSKAEPLFKRVLEINPQDYSTVVALAEVYSRQERPENAKQLLTLFEANYPDSAGAYELRIRREFQPNKEKAKGLISQAIKLYPDDGRFWYHSAWLAKQDGKLDDADKYFVKAAALATNAAYIQAGAAAFFRVDRKDNARALPYYLNTYFLDPHAHFDGFAEAKVSNLNSDIAREKVEDSVQAGRKLEDLASDPNPIVVAYALSKLSEKWDQTKTELFIRMMRHDDVLVRWNSMLTLITKDGPQLDTKITELLKDDDLRVRGLAAYIAVKVRGEKSFPEIRAMLRDQAQIIRFDAVSALLMSGGAGGKKIVSEHRSKESVKSLKDLIDASLKE